MGWKGPTLGSIDWTGIAWDSIAWDSINWDSSINWD